MVKWKIEDIDFDKQYENATKKAAENDLKEPRLKSVKYNKRTKKIVLELINGASFICPVNLIQGLSDASDENLGQVKMTPSKSGISWDQLDIYVNIVSLMSGMFGNKSWMSELGKAGGRVKSLNKSITSKENGKKGGRPKKYNIG